MQSSIGRAVWPVDAPDVEGLLRAADATMYKVKRARAGANGNSRDDAHSHAAAPGDGTLR